MSYVQTVLQPGEKVRFETNFHWIIYVPGLALIVLAGAAYAMAGRPDSWRAVWSVVAIVLLAGGLLLLARGWFRHFITEIAVTDRRIIYKYGFIRRKTNEMQMSKVESVEVDQSVLGSLLGYGNITVKGTGGGMETLYTISSAIEFRNHVTAE